jgi:hypothetical protein
MALLSTKVIAQRGFEPGYIVLHRGDTLSGLVKDRSREHLVTGKRIYLRHTNGKRARFKLGMVKSYKIGTRDYQVVRLYRKNALPLQEYYWLNHPQAKFMALQVAYTSPQFTHFWLEQTDFDSRTIDYVDLVWLHQERYMIRATQGLLGLKKNALRDYFSHYPEVTDGISSGQIKRMRDLYPFFTAPTKAPPVRD